MGALPSKNKKGSVVAIDTARRRRRRPAGPEKPNPPSTSVLALAVALVIAAMATTFGLWIVVQFVNRGNYTGAVMVPFWVIAPGCAPLAVLIVRRRRTVRVAHANVARFTANHRQGRPQPRNRF